MELITISRKNVMPKAITKGSNMIVYTLKHGEFLISKRNFNSLFMREVEINGILESVDEFSLPIFKTFRF